MSVILLSARLVLAVIFVIAGIAKLADSGGSRKTIADFGLPTSLAQPFAWLIPIAELICAAALMPVATAWWGATGILILLLIFTTGISISLIRGRKPDCRCFGQLHASPIGAKTLARNAFLAMVSGIIVWQGRENPGASIIDWTRGLGGSGSAVAALAVAVAGLAAFEFWVLVHVLRQNGRLLLRLEAVEAKLANRVDAPLSGLPMNSDAPTFTLMDLAGEKLGLETLVRGGKPALLVFTEPGCGACDAVLPEVGQWQRDYGDHFSIVPISRGDLKENRAKSAKYRIRNVLIQSDREVAEAYHVEATPSAVLVRDGRIESSLAMGADAIRGLVASATLPPSVKSGDLVPSLRLPDLSGQLFDLANVKSRALMLFWSPTCGFCQRMLDDLKKWERDPMQDAPELVVISAGGLEDNRKQGFRSRLLLDPYFAASRVFNSSGTPSAVLVEHGRVASEVAVGAQAVMALAGGVHASTQ